MEEQTQNQNTTEQVNVEPGSTAKAETSQTPDAADVEKNKALAIVAYFIFFIPLLAAKDSKFAMYHANQSLILLLAAIIVSIVGAIIPFIGWFLIGPLGSIFVFVLWIMGVLNAAKGEMKPVPVIGNIKILN